MKPISAIVNARLQSSRTRSKMVRSYCGTDLLEIALEKLNGLDFFTHRFLAVAEDELARKAQKYRNVEVLRRKPEAVEPGPHHPMVTFEHYTRVPTEWFFVINPCSAFLTPQTIRRAFNVFQQTDYPAYIAVEQTRDWIFSADGDALTHRNAAGFQNTSDGDYFLRATHAFYIANRDYFSSHDGQLWTLQRNDPHLIPMPAEEAVDVDTDLDFEFSEYLYSRKHGKS
jgi:CMP-N-acetylneuraminic acid synthetase